MKTLEQIIAWLKTSDYISNIIVEISGVQGAPSTLYLSSKPFVTSSTDTPANQRYDPCIVGGVSFSESLSLTSTISMGYGDIEIENILGSKDTWFDYIWVNRAINIYIGDVTWPRTDYRIIFSGIIADISSRNLSSINLLLTDKLQKLNNPVSETLLPTINTTNDVLIPVTFGEVFNVAPIVTDNVVNTLEYQVHTGTIEDIIEVRDNGIPVSITKNLAAGKFTLNQSPYGQLTCSVQGNKNITYKNNIAGIIKEIVKNYGPTATRLVDADIDLTNFSAFETAHPDSVGIYITNRETVLNVCNQLAASINAQIVMSSVGLLRLIQLDIPGAGANYSISYNDVEANSVVISDKPEVRGATKLAYSKNWTIQDGTVAAGVPTQNVTLFETEWMYTTITNNTVIVNYILTTAPQEELTLLNKKSEATAEATRRNNLWSTPRYLYTMKAYAHLLPVEIGDSITLTDSRFGLSAGKTGLVVSVSRDWLAGRAIIGVLV